MMGREAFARWPIHGNVLEALREGRLEIGAHALFEPGVWITAPGTARVRIGEGTFLNMGVMVAAERLVEIGDHCDHVAGLREQGPHEDRRQLLAWYQRGGHERRHHR
jgi:hypothetical protein